MISFLQRTKQSYSRPAAWWLVLLLLGGISAATVGSAAAALGPDAGAQDAQATLRAGGVREMPMPKIEEMGPAVYLDDQTLPTAPPPEPQVGDSWVWWLWVHWPMPPHFEQRTCTVRGRSDRAYVVVEDTQWNVTIDQADVDMILERWENSSIGDYPDQGIYDLNSAAFGDPPDELDDDPRIYIMWFDFGISSDGFFFYFDQYPEGTFPGFHSNECEVLYMNCGHGQNPSGDYMISVIAHEFEHMIHWKYDEDELSWVDEGLAELAMWLYGRPDVISAFNSAPDNSLIVWNGNWADYIKTYLWTLYFYERYGGGPAVYDVVHEPLNSIAGYDAVLDAYGYEDDFDEAFAHWTVANFLDDPDLYDGRYGYLGDELPPFNVSGTYSSYPTGTLNRTVNHWAADYYRFLGFGEQTSVRLDFDGADGSGFAVFALKLEADGGTQVMRMTLDPLTQVGSIGVAGLENPADEVILVVAKNSGSGSIAYSFSAQDDPAAIGDHDPIAWDDQGSWTIPPQLAAEPSPFLDELTLRFEGLAPSTEQAEVTIFDAAGRGVRTLTASGSGTVLRLQWDGRDRHGRLVAPGLYLMKARRGNDQAHTRVLRLQ